MTKKNVRFFSSQKYVYFLNLQSFFKKKNISYILSYQLYTNACTKIVILMTNLEKQQKND